MGLVWWVFRRAAQWVWYRLAGLIFWVFMDAAERHELRLWQRCGVWRYWDLMGPALRLPRARQRMFQWGLRRCARQARVADLVELLDYGWREHLVASWLIVAGCRTELRPRIVENLNAGEPLAYLGVALARFGTEQDALILTDYLTMSLALPEEPEYEPHKHHQAEAMAALIYLDQSLGTRHAVPVLAADGPWERWLGSSRADLEDAQRDLVFLMTFAQGGDPGPARW